MKIIEGSLKCDVSFRFMDIEIDKQALVRSNIIQKLKQSFNFSDVKIPENLEEESIQFEGGKFSYEGKDIIINEFSIGSIGLSASTSAETSKVKAFLNEVCEVIDNSKLFRPLTPAEKRERFITECKVKLDISSNSFLSKEFLSFLEKISTAFKREDFTLEIHPYTVGASFVSKPNLQELSKKSLTTAQIARLLREIRPSGLEISIDGINDFYEKIYTIKVQVDYDTLISTLEILENMMT